MKARLVSSGARLDYTPGSDVNAGDVILVGSQLGVASIDIPANSLGALMDEGIFDVVKKNEQQTAGGVVYWDVDGNPYGGVAGTGCLSASSADGEPFGIVQATAGATAGTARVKKFPSLAATITVHEMISTVIVDPGNAGAIPITNSGQVDLVTTAAQTRTLAAPTFKGQMLLISLKTDGGDCTITCATTINQTGNNTIVLGDAGDAVLLVAKTNGANIRWSVVSNDGCALSTV